MDFPRKIIEIRPGTNLWGPFWFDFRPALPDSSGDPIDSATVTSFLGGAETTDDLVETGKTTVNPVTCEVGVWLQHPGDTKRGQHELRFAVTLVSGGTKPFRFGYVEVK